MERQVRHRQPKGTETDWPPCTPPRQSSTLPGEGPGASKRPGLLDKRVGRPRDAETAAVTYNVLGRPLSLQRRTNLALGISPTKLEGVIKEGTAVLPGLF
jgi:hypothetical protein